MRYGMSLQDRYIRIMGKRNNWRPANGEREVPDCLDHLARPHILRIGESVDIPVESPSYRLLSRFLDGQNPEQEAIDRATTPIAEQVAREVHAICTRLRRKGMMSAPAEVNKVLFRLVREQIDATV